VTDYCKLAEEAARAGGRVLLSWVGRFGVREKGPADLVTEADLASQEAIRAILLGAHPDHAFIGEATSAPVDNETEYCWIVDPLDGTTNYVHQLPHYAVSIALVQRGRPIAAAILDPVHEECFTAARGQGAWLNGQPIRTSGVGELSQALIAASFAAKIDAHSPELDQFVAALYQAQAMRRTGSAALNMAYVAAGRFDAFWALSTKAWDVAAGALLIEEAGGVVSGTDGQPLDLRFPHPVASASPALHASFLRLLQTAPRRGSETG